MCSIDFDFSFKDDLCVYFPNVMFRIDLFVAPVFNFLAVSFSFLLCVCAGLRA